MAIIRLKLFGGELPIRHPTLLGDANAQTAKNLRNETGAIKPLRGLTTIQAQTETGTVDSIFRYTSSVWFEWTTDVNAVPSPIANDQYDRAYYTGDSYPKFTVSGDATSGGAPYPSVSYRLGIPSPSACTATISGTATDPTDLAETRYYVTTYVDAYGSEGPPSLPSGQVEWRDGQSVNLTAIPAAPAGNYNIANQYIYRVNTGTSGSVYQYVGSIAVATTTYSDTVAAADLGEALSTTTYDPPPDDTMTGLTVLPGEFLAAYYDNVICFSEPTFPHAWPLEYQLSTEHAIKGIGAFGNSLLVTTDANPYVITGIHPSSMVMTKLEIAQSCVSKRSVVDMGNSVIYASPDGLVQVGTSGIRLITEGSFNREEWQKLVPSSIHAYYWEGMYLGFYSTGTTTGGFSLKPSAPEEGVVFFDTYATAGYSDLEEDTLYLMESSSIKSWDTDSTNTVSYTWRSKPYLVPRQTNFGAVQILADTYPVSFTLVVDGEDKYSSSVGDENAVRLPSGYLSRSHAIQITGTGEVHEIVLASTLEELARV